MMNIVWKSHPQSIHDTNHYGGTALTVASLHGKHRVVSFLLGLGAQYDHVSDKGYTPLQFASQGGYTDSIGLLIQAGAKKDRKNKNGFTRLIVIIIIVSFLMITFIHECLNHVREISMPILFSLFCK